jgi:hypothetical protein
VGKGPLFTLQVTPLYALSNGLALGLESRFGILPTVTGAYALDGTVEGGALLSLSTVAAFRPVKNIEAKTGIGLEADLLVVSSGDVGHPWIGDVQTCSLLGPRAGASIGFVATGGFGLSLAGSASIRGECRILTLGVEGTYSTW